MIHAVFLKLIDSFTVKFLRIYKRKIITFHKKIPNNVVILLFGMKDVLFIFVY